MAVSLVGRVVLFSPLYTNMEFGLKQRVCEYLQSSEHNQRVVSNFASCYVGPGFKFIRESGYPG